MDKKLEEAVEYIEEIIALTEILPIGEVTIQEKELEMLEIILQALDNSISKEDIKEKIRIETLCSLDPLSTDENVIKSKYKIAALQELLEGK